MTQACLVCDTKGLIGDYIEDVFSTENVLPNNVSLLDILKEITNRPIEEATAKTKTLCPNCYKSCVSYYDLKIKMNKLKSKMCDTYTGTSQKIPIIRPVIKNKPTTVVVPASKLQPLPRDFQLNLQKLAAVSRANIINTTKPTSPSINLKVTIGSSVFTQSLKTSMVKMSKPLDNEYNKDTKDWTKQSSSKGMLNNNFGLFKSKGDDEMENNEEIVPVIQSQTQNDFNVSNIKIEPCPLSDDNQYINVYDSTSDNDFVLGNIFKETGDDDDDDDDNDEHTIMVDSDNPSILEMMSGKALVYENGELSLVMQEDDDDRDDDDDDEDDAEGGNESNDDSQIELQVSGDEETANAIIAAAQKKGGAFVKVQNGEMYEVKSVESKMKDTNSFDVSLTSLIAKEGSQFCCMVCKKMHEGDGAEKVVLDAISMMRHLKSEHDAKLYICQICGFATRRRKLHTTHFMEHSKRLAVKSSPNKSKVHECEVCNKCYNSRILLQEHMNSHSGKRPYSCDICQKTFASKYTFKTHLKTHEPRIRPYKCNQCEKSFLSQQNLNQHLNTHLAIKNFICSVCNKRFSTQHNLEVHGIVHTGERPYECDTCKKCFARRAELINHHRTHTGERPFECEQCGARFAQRSNLNSHRRATHLDDKRHQCTSCPKRFKRRRLLEYHIKATHTGERPLQCDVCLSTFVYPEHYKKHILIHSGERPFFCEICGKSFNSRDNRNTHRFTHSDKKPYECLSCGNSYMRKRQLIAHMNSSGHLAESIVVNQPRVTEVNENSLSSLIQLNDQSELSHDGSDKLAGNIFQTSSKIELASNAENEDITIEEDGTTQIFISTGNIQTGTEEATLIDAVNSTQLATQTTQLGDEVFRLIQVKLPDGNNGWVALND